MKHFRVEPPCESFRVNQEKVFINHGLKLMKRGTIGGRKVFDWRFRGFYGVKPRVNVVVWRLLKKQKWVYKNKVSEPIKEHLLLALRFMQLRYKRLKKHGRNRFGCILKELQGLQMRLYL